MSVITATISAIASAFGAWLTYLSVSYDDRHIKKIKKNKSYDVIIKPCERYKQTPVVYFNNIDQTNERNQGEVQAYLLNFQGHKLESIDIDGQLYYAGNLDTSGECCGTFVERPWQFASEYYTKKAEQTQQEHCKKQQAEFHKQHPHIMIPKE